MWSEIYANYDDIVLQAELCTHLDNSEASKFFTRETSVEVGLSPAEYHFENTF